jgi:uncharacterized SAM-binding protein YcdF (DUF218 family)
MIYLHKILPVFLSPIMIVLALLALGLWTRRRRWIIAGMAILYLVSTPLVSDSLFRLVQSRAERLFPDDAPQADAIVALSAGMGWTKTKNGFVAEWPTPNRFWGGVELLQAGNAPILLFTGGKLPWQRGDETEGEVLKRHTELMRIPSHQVWVTEQVENTEQEAHGARKLLGVGKNKIILVTSASHMRRAKAIFEQLGFDVFPYPVDTSVSAEDMTPMSFLPNPRALQTTQIALNELLGRLYYQVKTATLPSTK